MLNGVNVIKLTITWAESILRYSAAFIDWTNEELMLLLMTKNKLTFAKPLFNSEQNKSAKVS